MMMTMMMMGLIFIGSASLVQLPQAGRSSPLATDGGCFLRKMKASLWHVRAYGKATYKFLSAPLHLCNFPKRVGSMLVKIPLIRDGSWPKKRSRIDDFLAFFVRTRSRASLRRPTRQVVARFISRTPLAAPKRAPRRPRHGPRHPQGVPKTFSYAPRCPKTL